MASCKAFVTVGTTSFDSLINSVLLPEVLEVLKKKGITHLTLQIGRTQLVPQLPTGVSGIFLDWYNLKPSLLEDFQSASLVISHAGAGCCLEALTLKKNLVIVINECLMGNHQIELASRLSHDGHARMCKPETLLETLQSLDVACHTCSYVNGDPLKFAKFLDKYTGFA